MAILVNIGQRGFVLKEGFIGPGQQITADQETAEKLSRTYPNELKLVVQDKKEVEKILEPKEEPVKEEPVLEEKVEEPSVEEEPKKATRRGRKKAK
jgi:hypothetical protein